MRSDIMQELDQRLAHLLKHIILLNRKQHESGHNTNSQWCGPATTMSWCPEGKRSAVKTQRRQATQVVPQYQQPAMWPGNNYVMVPRWEAFSCQDTATSSNTSSASIPTASDVARQQLCHGAQRGSSQLSRHSDVKQHK